MPPYRTITSNEEPELGFFERGHLASDYKQLFGYFPSETFKNRT